MLELFLEERPALKPLPLEGFRAFTQSVRTVDDSGLVQIAGAYYAALPAPLHSLVTVRVYAHGIEIFDGQAKVWRWHALALRKGAFVMEASDRLFSIYRASRTLCAACAGAACAPYCRVDQSTSHCCINDRNSLNFFRPVSQIR